MDLKSFIKEKRPNLSASSIITYNSILTNLYRKVFGKEGDINTKRFEETTPILTYLKDVPCNKRKTTLSALVIITDDKAYRDLMLTDIKSYTAEIGKQEKTESQKENWVEGADIKSLWETLKSSLSYKLTGLLS